jgi:hypothetical protein
MCAVHMAVGDVTPHEGGAGVEQRLNSPHSTSRARVHGAVVATDDAHRSQPSPCTNVSMAPFGVCRKIFKKHPTCEQAHLPAARHCAGCAVGLCTGTGRCRCCVDAGRSGRLTRSWQYKQMRAALGAGRASIACSGRWGGAVMQGSALSGRCSHPRRPSRHLATLTTQACCLYGCKVTVEGHRISHGAARAPLAERIAGAFLPIRTMFTPVPLANQTRTITFSNLEHRTQQVPVPQRRAYAGIGQQQHLGALLRQLSEPEVAVRAALVICHATIGAEAT